MTEEGKRVQQLIQAIRDECEAIQRIVQKLKDSQERQGVTSNATPNQAMQSRDKSSTR